MSKPRKKKKSPKRVLALPDLEQAKSAVLNTLTSVSGQRTYDHAINEFVEWYCFSHETYRLWTSSGTQDERTDSTPWRRRAGVPDDVLMRRACLAKDLVTFYPPASVDAILRTSSHGRTLHRSAHRS